MPLVIIVTLLQVPFVRDNIEGTWLRDTTSIIHHLEAKYPEKVEHDHIHKTKTSPPL